MAQQVMQQRMLFKQVHGLVFDNFGGSFPAVSNASHKEEEAAASVPTLARRMRILVEDVMMADAKNREAADEIDPQSQAGLPRVVHGGGRWLDVLELGCGRGSVAKLHLEA